MFDCLVLVLNFNVEHFIACGHLTELSSNSMFIIPVTQLCWTSTMTHITCIHELAEVDVPR